MENGQWVREAAALKCLVDVHHVFVPPKEFSTGSRGWYASEKISLGDERCQVTVSVVVIGSKPDAKKADPEQTTTMPKKGRKALPKAIAQTPGQQLVDLVTSPPTRS